jgi:hypothetical protein
MIPKVEDLLDRSVLGRSTAPVKLIGGRNENQGDAVGENDCVGVGERGSCEMQKLCQIVSDITQTASFPLNTSVTGF